MVLDVVNTETAVQSGNRPVPAAERMRRHRSRRAQGLRCFTVELRETEIAALVRQGFLQDVNRRDHTAVTEALHTFLDRSSLNKGV